MMNLKKANLLNKKISAIIPARGGSKGIPRKNIKLLKDHPLLAYTIAACKMSKNIDRVIVSTEDEEIASIALRYGAEVPFMRPVELSSDDARDAGFLKHFFDNIDVSEVALMRPTSPLRNPEIIDQTIEIFFTQAKGFSSLRTVHEMSGSPYKVFKIVDNCCQGFFEDFNGIKKYSNLPRQTFPTAYEANGYIDIVRKEVVTTGETFGDKIFAREVEKIVDIDSHFDFDIASFQIEKEKHILLEYLGEF